LGCIYPRSYRQHAAFNFYICIGDDMKKEKKKRTKAFLAGIICTLALLFAGLFAAGVQVYAEEPASAGGNEQLVITVVEEMEAEDIEEDEIPLAAYPTPNEQYGRRHAILAGTVFAMTCCYALYFILYERKLLRLKQEAAELEYKRMNERKAQL